jgi:prepilin-type N-terminal cleavage/methylation domain-containing protein
MPSCGMRRSGFTLLELALVLALLALLLSAAAPGLTRARATLASRAARAEIIAAIAATRALAVLTGGAQLVVTPAGELRVERADGTLLREPIHLAARYGVAIETERDLPVVLRYDGLGIGRMTSTTVRIRRRDAVLTVTVSAYGRARS